MNLYGFVGNDAVFKWDYLGMVGYPGYYPPPPTHKWPQKINPEVYEDNKWHYTYIAVIVIVCGCCELDVSGLTEKIQTFSEFNKFQNLASIEVDGSSAGFRPVKVMDSIKANCAGLSDIAGVTLSGPGCGYLQQATTNGLHPLVGKRRWGIKELDAKPCNAIEIFTEAYESMNNLAGAGGDTFRRNAANMWVSYLTGLGQQALDACPGSGGLTVMPIVESGPDNVPAIPLPWQ